MATLVTGGEVKKGSGSHQLIWGRCMVCRLSIGRSPMSLKSLPIPPIPEEVIRIAHAVFPRGNVVMQMRDTLGAIYTDEAFADLFPTHGQPAFAPWRLALVTVFQFMEGLTDRQAADAVRDRLALTMCAMSRSNLSLTQSANETQRKFLRTTNLPDAERLKGT